MYRLNNYVNTTSTLSCEDSLTYSFLGYFATMLPHSVSAQTSSITVSGVVNDQKTSTPLPYVNVILKTEQDTAFVTGTFTDGDGRFTLSSIKPGNYRLEFSLIGYTPKNNPCS